MEICNVTEEEEDIIHSLLREHNRAFMTSCEDYSLSLKEEGNVVGGVVASSLGDCVEVEFLFITPPYRGKGYARRLLSLVEERAVKEGKKRILLNTYSFQAPELYRKLGFEEVGSFSPSFDSYSQYFFQKVL